jgi:hypothetical protein
VIGMVNSVVKEEILNELNYFIEDHEINSLKLNIRVLERYMQEMKKYHKKFIHLVGGYFSKDDIADILKEYKKGLKIAKKHKQIGVYY